MSNNKGEYEEHVEGHVSGDVENQPESNVDNDQPTSEGQQSPDNQNELADGNTNNNHSAMSNDLDSNNNDSNQLNSDLDDSESTSNQSDMDRNSDDLNQDMDQNDKLNDSELTDDQLSSDEQMDESLPDESKDLNADDLNSSNQSDFDSDELANDLPHHNANPDEDSQQEADAAEESNPDEDAQQEADASEDSNPDEDSKQEADASEDASPDDDAKQEGDASEESNPDEDSEQENNSNNATDVDPTQAPNDTDDMDQDVNSNQNDGHAGNALQKGADAVGYGDELKAAKSAKTLADSIKDAKGNSQQKVKNAAIEMGTSTAKGFIKTTVLAYGWPVILAVAGILLLLFVLIGTYFIAQDTEEDKPKGGCSAGDQKAATESITSSKDVDKQAEKIYKYLMQHVDGSKPKAVAAHLGNMFIESARTFDPSTVQGNSKFNESQAKDPSVGGYALGVAQWDTGRRVNLLKYADKKGKKWDDLGLQLDFMLNGDGSDSSLVKKLLKDDGSVEDITSKFMNQWERAGAKDSISERQAAAKKYYAKFGDMDTGGKDSNISDSADAGSDNSDACGDDGGGKTDGKMGASVKPNGGSGKVLEVWDGKDKVPEKYKKMITLPDFSEKALDKLPGNMFKPNGQRGQCTEFTWGYMSQLWSGTQPTDGNGNAIYKAYKREGAKTTKNPTVGYGFSSDPPLVGASLPSVGHTGVVVGVLKDGKYLIANYNLRGEANKDHYTRHLTYALVDGQPKSGNQATFFSGAGNKPKVKTEK